MQKEEEKSILVIDDDITIRKLITHHLKLNNYKVFEAINTDEGFSVLNEEKIDLVLCDVMLGDMDGFTFCQKVRENENHRLIPFVFVTVKSSFEDKNRALEVGGDDIINKPFEIPDLILKVKTLLRRSEIYKNYGVKKNITEQFDNKKAQIVLVDDDVSLSKLFQFNLNRAGFDCKVAHSAEEGLKLIKAIRPDVIVSDIMMPKMDGYQLRNRILEDTELRTIPFIFLTAKNSEEEILKGYDLDIVDYVLKTAGPKLIVAKVSAVIKSLEKERKKVVSELHHAADSMSARMVPAGFPDFEGFNIRHWHVPFSGIPGGDFIDYFKLDENHLAVILGDVMGKRWGAWYFANAYAGYVRSSLRGVLESGSIFSPANILEKLNSSIYQDSKISEVFVTLSLVILNNKDLTAVYSGAGDLPLLHKNFSNNSVTKYQSDGLLLGFSRNGEFSDSVINVEQNDSLILSTDGIVESTNAADFQYGTKRMITALQNLNGEQDHLEAIKSDITKFTDNNFDDDVSLVVISVQ